MPACSLHCYSGYSVHSACRVTEMRQAVSAHFQPKKAAGFHSGRRVHPSCLPRLILPSVLSGSLPLSDVVWLIVVTCTSHQTWKTCRWTSKAHAKVIRSLTGSRALSTIALETSAPSRACSRLSLRPGKSCGPLSGLMMTVCASNCFDGSSQQYEASVLQI